MFCLYTKNHLSSCVSRMIISSLLLWSTQSLWAADQASNKNSLTSDAFVNAFIDTPMNSSNSNNRVKFRGISLKKTTINHVNTKKEIADSACLAGKKSVAININFSANSTKVDDVDVLNNIAQAMNSQQLNSCYFVIEGHTDASGNDYYNLWLSQKRAEQVKQYLREHDVTEDRLIVVGKGESELLNTNTPQSKENRRVVFKVINYKKL